MAAGRVGIINNQISRLERRQRALEQKIRTLQRQQLRSLADRMGFESADQLILALAEYASPDLRAHIQSAGLTARLRVPFPLDLKEKIRAELAAGEKSVAKLSRQYGPSQPTIMGWKREWGMTRPRQKKTPQG